MTTHTTVPGYSHTQAGPLCLILYGTALIYLAVAWLIVGDTPGFFIVVFSGLLVAIIATCFRHLTVVDQGEMLMIRFDPIRLFRQTVRYTNIEKVEVGRALILPWSLWGGDCIVVHLRNGSVLRIGTDDGESLVRFLAGKIGQPGSES